MKDKRIIYAKLLLETEFLPHVSTKANKLIKASIGVITEDDRDYYGKKRLEMAGSLWPRTSASSSSSSRRSCKRS